MVRVFLKGGVWKNSEDEILKAAVQKYGKQQWARVASLLNRKTAKQAKARWHEWLDPSIKKTDWSREEEEKLLHLAKLLPAQWKTIAPLVGRTSNQCQEHYERLLDQAATGGEASDLRSAALRPGQIDAHPETKPARPDPIDMDEDELEMLQEARARLANTQGKKAKRKEREKALLQAKRLADLQKRRELKQAGLLSKKAIRKSRRNKKEIDFGVEIPFHKPAPSGFHDVSSEVVRSEVARNKRLKNVDYQKINENQYRSRDAEALRRQKQEAQRLKIIQESAAKYGKPKEDEKPARPRGVLSLPSPTMTDTELVQMSKIQQQLTQDGTAALGESAVTNALLGDYSDRPLPTPMRQQDAATVSTQQTLLREASQMRSREHGQTPLLQASGTDGDELEHEDFDKKPAAFVANAATPLPDRAGVGRTPRDHFGLNQSDAASVGASTFASTKYSIRDLARQERRAAKRARHDLELALANLPAPQFEYDLAAPSDLPHDDAVDDKMQVETVMEHDKADVERAALEKQELKAKMLYQARSTVVKRPDLPRPAVIPGSLLADESIPSLVADETLLLLCHDAYSHPCPAATDDPSSKKRKQSVVASKLPPKVTLQDMSSASLNEAREFLESETTLLVNEKVAKVLGAKLAFDRDEAMAVLSNANVAASLSGASNMTFVECWKDNGESVSSLKHELEMLQSAVSVLAKKNRKSSSKLTVVTGGYAKRVDKMQEESLQLFADERRFQTETAVFGNLQSHERQGASNRIESLRMEISSLKDSEARLQKEYGDVKLELRRKMVEASSKES